MGNSGKLKGDLHNSIAEGARVVKRAERFKMKSWCEEYIWLRKATGFVSWVIQVLAVVAAFYGAKLICEKGFEDVNVVIAVALIVLVVSELLQRHSSDKLWDKYWSSYQWSVIWLSLSVGLFLFTGAIGTYGTFQSVTHLADAPTLITQDSILQTLKNEEAVLKKEIASIESQTNHEGVIFYHLQPGYDKKLDERAALSKKIISRQEIIEANNKQAAVRSAADVERDGWNLVAVFALFALFFEMCMCFNSYYDFREECEDNEEMPEAFLKKIGVVELHPIIAKKYPKIAAKIQPRQIGFQTPQSSAASSQTGAGFLKNYTPPAAKQTPPPQADPTPPPTIVETVVDASTGVATSVEPPTKTIVATKEKPTHTVEFKGVKDPEEELKLLLKKGSPYNSNLNNPKRENSRESDSNACKEIFKLAEQLDWEMIGEGWKKKWVIWKNRIESNPNFIQ